MRKPLVIAHRGASGYRPEHTIEAYRLAIEQGADFIEPDLVATRDGVLIARHEADLSGTTDIASRPEFAARRTDGGFLSHDFDWAEIQILRARERIPEIRPGNARFDGQFGVPRIEEIVALARKANVGIYPEIKSPAYFATRGFDLGEMLVDVLRRERFERAYIQSFEPDSLRALAGCGYPLVQLFKDDTLHLREIATYAQAIGPRKDLPDIERIIREARDLGLEVHPWTLRSDAAFRGDRGSMDDEALALFEAGATGAFFDQPDRGVAIVERFMRGR